MFPDRHLAIASAFLEPGLAFYSFGRYALCEALRRAGVGPEGAVLLPTLHCRAIVEPVLHLRAEARFYPVTPDLRPDMDALELCAEQGGVRAMVLTHYFGFANALDEAQDFCARHGIALIEDCAHAFYGEHRGKPLGTFGSYAAASAWKFFPVRDGAVFRDNVGGPPVQLGCRPMIAELKGGLALLERTLQRAKSSRQPLPALDGPELAARAARLVGAGDGEAGDPVFLPQFAADAGARLSRALTAHAAHGRIIESRRKNYLRWLEAAIGLPGAVPLFTSLPDGVVPYAFPLLGDSDGRLFHALKLAGVPLWRWEDMAVTDCQVAAQYRMRLAQLPCHQSLSADEMGWMLTVLKSVLSTYRPD